MGSTSHRIHRTAMIRDRSHPGLAKEPRRRRQAAALAVLVALLLAACGDDEPADDPGTQPAPDVSTFEQGRFDELPLPPEAEPLGPRSEDDGIVARSYSVPNLLPRDVIDFYSGALREEGWEQLGDVEELADGFRADWTTSGWNLRVSANEAPALEREGTTRPVSQISLVLSPADATTVPDEGA